MKKYNKNIATNMLQAKGFPWLNIFFYKHSHGAYHPVAVLVFLIYLAPSAAIVI